jgi:hypothetical protein
VRRIIVTVGVVVASFPVPLLAHPVAQRTVMEEVYEMFETLVSDTPHATQEPSAEVGTAVCEMSVSTRTSPQAEALADDVLLDELPMLDDEIVIAMRFDLCAESSC